MDLRHSVHTFPSQFANELQHTPESQEGTVVRYGSVDPKSENHHFVTTYPLVN